jgi:hypothetical protein
MRLTTKFVWLNVAAVVGVAVSLLLVPGNTPLWLWGTIAVVIVGALNVFLLGQRGDRAKSGAGSRPIIIALGVALLLIDIILSRQFR